LTIRRAALCILFRGVGPDFLPGFPPKLLFKQMMGNPDLLTEKPGQFALPERIYNNFPKYLFQLLSLNNFLQSDRYLTNDRLSPNL
jgi:hypothetical protein